MTIRVIKKITKKFLGIQERKIIPQTLEEQIYQLLLLKNDVCFDIGANDGGVAMLMSELVGMKGIIYAFEPVWINYLLMSHYIQNNKYLKANIITIPIGLSDKNGETSINIPNGDYGMGSIAPSNTWKHITNGTEIVSQKCFLLTFDYFLKITNTATPDFIKIDVEGAELLLLKGATEFFEKGSRPLIFMEVFAPWEKAFNYQPYDLFSFLMKYQYCFYFVCPEGLVEFFPTKQQQFPKEYINGYNIIAFNKDKHQNRIPKLDSLLIGNNDKILPMIPASFLNVIK